MKIKKNRIQEGVFRYKFNDLKLIALLFILSVLLFFPVLNKPLASDDYQVMYRLVYEKDFFISGFFRPVSDATLYFSYLIGGFNPLSYNLFNLFIHALTVWLLYKICLKLDLGDAYNKNQISLLSALFFLVYPFHNESIVWGVGRASIVACVLAFASLYFVLAEKKENIKIAGACILYFIGLCSYETIITLPLIAIILCYTAHNKNYSFLKKLGAFYTLTLVINLLIRRSISGVVTGSYGERIFSFQSFFSRIFKGLGRLLLPPLDESNVLAVFFIMLSIIIVYLTVYTYLYRRDQWVRFIMLSAIVLFSSSIPVLFGVSTKTVEGDRLFYFPSFFLCIWISFCVLLIKKKLYIQIVSSLIVIYFVTYLHKSNSIWKQSGLIISKLITQLKLVTPTDDVFLINMPGDYKGAQIFRNGLKEALLINNIDTAGLRVVNYVEVNDEKKDNKTIMFADTLFVPPSIFISRDKVFMLTDNRKVEKSYVIDPADQVYYWNKGKLEKIEIDHLFF